MSEDCIKPYLDLWGAVLAIMIEDAQHWHCGRKGRTGDREAAYKDLLACGPMTCHLARLNLLDPTEISDQFYRWCEQELAARSASNVRTNRLCVPDGLVALESLHGSA